MIRGRTGKSSKASVSSSNSSAVALTKEQKRALPCHFHSTPKGCQRGAKCPFSHTLVGTTVAKAVMAIALVASCLNPVSAFQSLRVQPRGPAHFDKFAVHWHFPSTEELGTRIVSVCPKDELGCRVPNLEQWLLFRSSHKRHLSCDPVGPTTAELFESIDSPTSEFCAVEAVNSAINLSTEVGTNLGIAILAHCSEDPIGDTGASMHLISHAEATRLGSEIHETRTTIKLSTAKGITESNTEALVRLPNFTEPLVHQILEETPHALSIGRLVEEEDCRQIWNRIDGFRIVDKNGNLIPTNVRNYVPFFTNAVDLAFSALPANNRKL